MVKKKVVKKKSPIYEPNPDPLQKEQTDLLYSDNEGNESKLDYKKDLFEEEKELFGEEKDEINNEEGGIMDKMELPKDLRKIVGPRKKPKVIDYEENDESMDAFIDDSSISHDQAKEVEMLRRTVKEKFGNNLEDWEDQNSDPDIPEVDFDQLMMEEQVTRDIGRMEDANELQKMNRLGL